MTVYAYKAFAAAGEVRRGELPGATEAEVRAALRRIGLQVVDITPLRARPRNPRIGDNPTLRGWSALLTHFRGSWQRNLRGRRKVARADLLDSLSTLLRSGVTLVDAVGTVAKSRGSRSRARSGRRAMLLDVRERLRSGTSLSEAFREHPEWFDVADAAVVEAALLGGTLPETLAALADRTEHSGQLGQKVVAAMTYPAIVASAGIGVAIFLGVRTLPQLAGILEGAHIEVPRLTRVMMAIGAFAVSWGFVALVALLVLALLTPLLLKRLRVTMPRPALLRRLALGEASLRLSELLTVGVPVTDALRAVAPGTPPELDRLLRSAAARVERGEDLAAALNDPRWFEEEFTRVIAVGEAGGELPVMLERLGRRLERDARRRIDRLTALAEPIVVLLLAVMVGLIVMAAILPLVRIKDII